MSLRKESLVIFNPLMLLIILVLLYFTVSFCTDATTGLIYYVLNHDKEPSWQWKGVYAIVFSLALYFVLRQIDYPIVALQHRQIKSLFV